ncbi:MAG: hypothetical protein HY741_22810 [Chloroflexi bacterium]|nr:hypothetical protein [Chloroflexota bacterium]
MSKYRVVGVRPETDKEQAEREWFDKQVLESPSNLEEAARLLIGLITGLIGVLFTVIAIADNPPPAYLQIPLVRVLGAVAVVLLLLSLIACLVVVIPTRWKANAAEPATERATFSTILQRKARALFVGAILFGAGVIALGVVLMIALFS